VINKGDKQGVCEPFRDTLHMLGVSSQPLFATAPVAGKLILQKLGFAAQDRLYRARDPIAVQIAGCAGLLRDHAEMEERFLDRCALICGARNSNSPLTSSPQAAIQCLDSDLWVAIASEIVPALGWS